MARRGAGEGQWIAVVGTRPNYVKLAPLVRAARNRGRRLDWIQTGQHTAHALTHEMAQDLSLPPALTRLRPLPAGPGRIAAMSERLGRVLRRHRPALVVALGDVDSTLACALAAWRLDLPLAHIEAGLRAFEPKMPEERNRILVDGVSDRLYLTEAAAEENLRAEGVAVRRIRKPGNVMADALLQARPAIDRAASRLDGVPAEPFGVVTLHRQANVDTESRLAAYARALGRIARDLPLVFPVHPRTAARLRRTGWDARLARSGVLLKAPRPYLAFLGLVSRAAVVVTDSGGLPVEAALLGTPCVTARRTTEHLLTLQHGGNRLAGGDPRRLPAAVAAALAAPRSRTRLPRAWDGHAAERIVADWCKGFDRPPRLPGPAQEALRGL